MNHSLFSVLTLIAITPAFGAAAVYDPVRSDTEQWTWTGLSTGWQVGYVPDTSYLAGIRQTTKARYFFDLPPDAFSLAGQVTLNFTLPAEATATNLLSYFTLYLVDDTTESVFYWFTPSADYAADHKTLFSKSSAPFPATLDLDITSLFLGTSYATDPTFRIEVTAYVGDSSHITLPSAPSILVTPLLASIPEPAGVGLLAGVGALVCALRRRSRPLR